MFFNGVYLSMLAIAGGIRDKADGSPVCAGCGDPNFGFVECCFLVWGQCHVIQCNVISGSCWCKPTLILRTRMQL